MGSPFFSFVTQDVSADIRELFAVTERLVLWSDMVGPRLARTMKAMAPVYPTNPADQANAATKWNTPGLLKNSISYQRRTSVGRVRLDFISTGVPYALNVVEGTAGHPITPRSAGVLHFWGRDGVEAFREGVFHPDTPANPFPRLAFEHEFPDMVASFLEMFKKAKVA